MPACRRTMSAVFLSGPPPSPPLTMYKPNIDYLLRDDIWHPSIYQTPEAAWGRSDQPLGQGMQNLQIGQRLMLGFGVILVLMVGLAFFSERQVSNIQKSLATINDVNSVKQRYTINFRGSVHDRAINLRDVVLVGTTAEVDASVATIERLAEAYAKSAKPLDDLMAAGKGVTTDEQEILASIKATEIKTQPLITEVVRLQARRPGGCRQNPSHAESPPRLHRMARPHQSVHRPRGSQEQVRRQRGPRGRGRLYLAHRAVLRRRRGAWERGRLLGDALDQAFCAI